jgi:hypothetical protein
MGRRGMVSMLNNEVVTLEPADHKNVELLIRWTFDPVAQGPYKRVPWMMAVELHGKVKLPPEESVLYVREKDH